MLAKLRHIGLFLFLFFFSEIGISQTIRVSPDLNFTNKDFTEFLINKLRSKVDTIYFDASKKEWEIGPVILKNIKNLTIVMAKDLVIKAKSNAFPNKSDALLKFISCENLKVLGNNGILKMKKHEYLNGEWRHAISIRNCMNIVINKLGVYDSGGDGIYISGLDKGSYSENIYLDDVISSNNKRQGISIISAQNVFVNNCVFEKTKGTLPGAGLDIEPNGEYDRIVNVNFKNCTFRNNDHAGIMLSLGKLSAKSKPISVKFQNCYLTQNHAETNRYPAAEIVIGASKISPVLGKVLFKECLIENSKWGFLYSRKLDEAFHVTFSECAALNISKKNTSPIYFEVPDYKSDYGPLGGFTFDKMYINYNAVKPFLQIRGSSQGTLSKVKNVKGDFIFKGNKLQKVKYLKYNPANNENVHFNYLPDLE